MKRWLMAFVLCVWLTAMGVLPVSAATERNLLVSEDTALTSDSGRFSYTTNGVLVLESTSEEGVSVAITTDALVNIHTMRYLQLSLQSDCAFNIALKVSGADRDFYPQLTGPSWYEAFQETAPADGEGVSQGGIFTLSQDIVYYADYNELAIAEGGYATVKTVFITLKGVGKLTLEHLVLSSEPTFITMSNHTGVLAEAVPPLPEYSLDFTEDGQEEDEGQYDALAGDSMHEGQEWETLRPIVWILGGAVVVTVIAVIIVRKKVPRRLNYDVFDDKG